jgi:RNA polymerase sigma-70 factor (ECF subfamily)
MASRSDEPATPLATSFVASLADPGRGEGVPLDDLEKALASALAEARARWPRIDVDGATFARYLAERVADEGELLACVASLHHADLYVACACVRGDAVALAALEQDYFASVDMAAARVRVPGLGVDELRQVMREKLLVAGAEGPAKIAAFTGQGQLRNWLRVASMRTALNLARGPSEVPVKAEQLLDLPGAVADPELDYIKRTYREEFKAAFASSLDALSSRERNLVRYAIGQGMNAESIAPIYGVHATTVRRWLAGARDTLFEGVRREMMARLRVNRPEFESILRLIQSRLEVTLGGDAS